MRPFVQQKGRFTICRPVILALVLSNLTIGCGPSEAERAKQQQLEQEVQQLRAENQELQKLRQEHDELVRLRKDNQEILKLRADHQKYQQLQKDYEKLQSQNQQLNQFAQQLQQTHQQESAVLRNQNQQLQGTVAQNQANACNYNLRIIQSAKDQWALEKKKTVGILLQPDDLKPYLKGNQVPACPAGGTYSINAVGVIATCSINGHKLQ